MEDITTQDIEKLLAIDAREKKKSLSGVHGRASRTGRLGFIYNPSDLLSPAQKREYTKPGEVIVYNMYDNIIALNEFKQLPEDKQKEVLTKWKDTYGTTKILDTWKISRATLYKMYHKLGVPVDGRKSIASPQATPTNYRETMQDSAKERGAYFPEETENNKTNFMVKLNGVYKGKDIVDRIMKIGQVVENTDNDYYIFIELREL